MPASEADALFVVLTGEVEVAVSTEEGRDVWLAKLGAGSVVGEMGVLDGGSRSAGVRAAPRTELWRIGRRAVIDTLCEEPTLGTRAVRTMMARRLRATDILLQNTALLDLGARLARLLLETEERGGRPVPGGIARLIGASRERVNRKLAAWRSEGWIDVGAYGVKLLNREALAAAAAPPPAV